MDKTNNNHETLHKPSLMKRQIVSWQIFGRCISGCLILFLCSSLCFRFPIAIGIPGLVFLFVFAVLILSISCNSKQHPLCGDVICAVIIFGMIMANIFGVLWFYSGTTVLSGTFDLDWFLLLVRPGLILLLVGFFIYFLVRLYKRSDDMKELLIRIILLIAIVLAHMIRPHLYKPGRILFLRGLTKTVNAEIEISAIQSWLSKQQIPPKEPDPKYRTPYYLKGVGHIEVSSKEQPKYVRKFSNKNKIFVLYDWTKKEFYTLRAGSATWLCGFDLGIFQWRVVIGLPTMEIPLLTKSGQEVLEIFPGVYAWCSYQSCNPLRNYLRN